VAVGVKGDQTVSTFKIFIKTNCITVLSKMVPKSNIVAATASDHRCFKAVLAALLIS
jgi:hypothetical protein